MIERLKEEGFIVEMDDFGSGYSSLNMLSELPIDVILSQAEHNVRKQKVMEFAINLAGALQIQVIAEGVETEEQALFLKKMGCRHAQGYLYGPGSTGGFVRSDKKKIRNTFAMFLILLLLTILILAIVGRAEKKRNILQSEYVMISEISKIQYAIDSRLLNAEILEMLIVNNHGTVTDFEMIAERLYEDDSAVCSWHQMAS